MCKRPIGLLSIYGAVALFGALVVFTVLLGAELEGKFASIGRLDNYASTNHSEAALEGFDVFVAQADAAFAVAARNGQAVARTAVDTDTPVAASIRMAITLRKVQAHEPSAIGWEGAAPILEIVCP